MTAEHSAHLSEETLNDVLIGMSAPEADAHLAACPACRSQLEEFRSTMQLFNQTSLAWSEARPMKKPARSVSILRPYLLGPASWALAAVALLAIALPVWQHEHRAPVQSAPVAAAEPEESPTQIAQDNDLLQAVNVALNTDEASPLSEYRLSNGPRPRLKARPESRNR